MHQKNKTTFFSIITALVFTSLLLTTKTYADTPPATITTLTGFAEDTSVALEWTTPSNNGFAITDYSVQYRLHGASSWSTFTHSAFTTNSVSVTGLVDGNLYDFQVAAINSGGTATYSNVADVDPMPIQKSDNFESYTIGSNINGQGGWVSTSPADSVWQVETGNGGKALVNTTSSDLQLNSTIFSSGTFGDSQISADFSYQSGVLPVLWLRRSATSYPSDGYILYQQNNALDFASVSGGTFTYISGVSIPFTLTQGVFYTLSFEVDTNAAGNPQLNGWIYPIGSQPGAPVLSYTDTSNLFLNPGYAGFGDNSDTGAIIDNVVIKGNIPASAPSAITTLTAVPGDSSVNLSWTAPANNRAAITDYSVQYRNAGSSSWSTFSHSPFTTSSVNVTGLTNGNLYDFQVAAINAVGTAPYSNSVSTEAMQLQKSDTFESYLSGSNLIGQGGWVSDEGSWSAGSGESGQGAVAAAQAEDYWYNDALMYGAKRFTDSSISLDFKAVSSGYIYPTMWLRRLGSTSDSQGYFLYSPDSGSTFDLTNYTPSGHVTAGLASGTSSVSIVPGNFYRITFQVTTNTAGHPVLTLWEYQVGSSPGQPIISYTDTNNTYPSGFDGFGSDQNLPNATYDNVTINGDALQAAPGAISNLSEQPANNSVVLNWTAPDSSSAITDYSVQYRVNGTSSWNTFAHTAISGTVPTTAVTTTVAGLSDGNIYQFQVAAINGIGTAAYSNIVAESPTSSKNYYYILSTGQSLSTGGTAIPALSVTQPYNNLMFSPGVESVTTPLIPLFESGQGENGNVETPSSGIANSLSAYIGISSPFIVGLSGKSGTAYSGLEKGTSLYTKALTQATNANTYVNGSLGGTLIPTAVTVTHGEQDYGLGNASLYEGYLEQWQSDLQTDVNAIAGTSSTLPMFISQMNAGYSGELAQAQLQAHIDNPGKIILVGPKYQMTYTSPGNLHLVDTYSRYLGELYAKVINWVQFQHKAWNPLMPTAITVTDNKIDISYDIPVGNLAIDTNTVAQRPNDGFEFLQTGGNSPTITNVALINNNSEVELTLSAIPTGTNMQVRYAWTCYGGYGGPLAVECGQASDSTMVGGNIRDTDSSVSTAVDSTNLPLYDWGVTFDEPVSSVTLSSSGGGGGGGSYTPPTNPNPPIKPVSPAVPVTPTPSKFGTNSVLVSDHGTYYLISGDSKLGITNPGILKSYGFAFSDATTMTQAESALPTSSNLPPNNGALVKTKADPTVYLISGNQRYGFASAKVFTSLGYKFTSVVTVTTPELNQLPVATALTTVTAHLPGTNIVLNKTVYWIGTDDQLHAYPSIAIYNSWNIDDDFSAVVPANQADAALQIGSAETARS